MLFRSTLEQDTTFSIAYDGPSGAFTQSYDYVIIAAPWHQSDITFANIAAPPSVEYTRVYVTVVTTSSQYLESSYFRMSGTTVPETIFCTFEDGTTPDFYSIEYFGTVKDSSGHTVYFDKNYPGLSASVLSQGSGPLWVYRVVTGHRPSTTLLKNLFGADNIGWKTTVQVSFGLHSQ